MNVLVKRAFSIYKVFIRNRLATSVMMLVSGVMMLMGALNGRGNDTVTMPLGITAAGAVFTFWSFYKIGYLKAVRERAVTEADKQIGRANVIMQILETALYFVVAAVGIFLLINHDFMDMVLNLMAGFFTTLNAVTGAAMVIKNRGCRDFKWWIKVVLSVVELVMGVYFLMNATGIDHGWFTAMAVLTTVAGVIEVLSALTPEVLNRTKKDGEDIIKILKT